MFTFIKKLLGISKIPESTSNIPQEAPYKIESKEADVVQQIDTTSNVITHHDPLPVANQSPPARITPISKKPARKQKTAATSTVEVAAVKSVRKVRNVKSETTVTKKLPT